jgi:hypothetical protein
LSQAEATRKREQLAKGFKSLAAGAVSEDHAEEPVHPSVTAGQGAGQRVAVADEFDIARVLDSKSDLECLKVSQRGMAVKSQVLVPYPAHVACSTGEILPS